MPGVQPIFHALVGHARPVLALAAAPHSGDSTYLIATGSEDGTARIWDVRTRKAVRAALLGAPVNAVAFAPGDGALALLASRAGQVLEYDLRTDQVLMQTNSRAYGSGEASEINHLDAHSQGRLVGAVDDAGAVHVIERASGRDFKRFRTKHSNIATCVAFRPKRAWELLSAGLDCRLIRWDFSKGAPVRTYDLAQIVNAPSGGQMVNPPFVHALACTRTGRHAVTGLGDGSVVVTNLESHEHAVLSGHTYSVAAVALLGADEHLLSAGNDRRLNVWSLPAAAATSTEPMVPLDPRRACIELDDKPNAMVCCGDVVAVAPCAAPTVQIFPILP